LQTEFENGNFSPDPFQKVRLFELSMSWQTLIVVRPVRLWSADPGQSRRASWLELFFDLIFVAAVAQVGVPLGEDYTLHGLMRYALMFLLIWWAWLGHTMYSTRFDADDVVQRLLTLLQIFAAAAMAANAKAAFDSRDSAGFAAAYAVLRAVLVVQYLRACRLKETRRLTTLYAVGFGVAACLWGVAAIIPAPMRFWLWAAALLIDIGTPWLAVQHTHKYPPDAEHLPERFGLFTIILLGESVAAVMHGMESQDMWSPSAAISAFTGLSLAFGYWWWYFDGARGAAKRHVTSSRKTLLFQIWSYAHLPLYLCVAVVGVGVEHVISLPRGAHLHREDAWILTGAAAALMTTLTIIGFTSDGVQMRRPSLVRWVVHFALCLAALPASLVATAVPPCMLLIYLALLCAVQVMLMPTDSVEQRAELKELELVAELQGQ
jgi:low temperature requirement protein LtrA